MADYTSYCLQDKNELKALGSAIRSKAGVSGTLTVPQMTNVVKNISTETKKVVVPTYSAYVTEVDNQLIPRITFTSQSSSSGYANATGIEIYKLGETGISSFRTANGSSVTLDLLSGYAIKTSSQNGSNLLAARAIASNGMGSAFSSFEQSVIGGVQVHNCSLSGDGLTPKGIFTGLSSLGQDAYATVYFSHTAIDGTKIMKKEVHLSRISYADDCDLSNQIFRGEVEGYCTIEISANLANADDEETLCSGYDGLNYSSVSKHIGYSKLNYIKVIVYQLGDFFIDGNIHDFDQPDRDFYFFTNNTNFGIERGQYTTDNSNKTYQAF